MVLFVIDGPIGRADIAGLCERARALLEGNDGDAVVVDVAAIVDPDAVTVDALARLHLTARRLGCRVRLVHACGQLQELLALIGLRDVVPLVAVRPRAEGAGRRAGRSSRCRGRSRSR